MHLARTIALEKYHTFRFS